MKNIIILNEEIRRISKLMGVNSNFLLNEAAMQPPNLSQFLEKAIEKFSGKSVRVMDTADIEKAIDTFMKGTERNTAEFTELEKLKANKTLSTAERIAELEKIFRNPIILDNTLKKLEADLEVYVDKMFDEFIQKNPELKQSLDDLYTYALKSEPDLSQAEENFRYITTQQNGLPASYIDRYLKTLKRDSQGYPIITTEKKMVNGVEEEIPRTEVDEPFLIKEPQVDQNMDTQGINIDEILEWTSKELITTPEQYRAIINNTDKNFLEKFYSQFANRQSDLQDFKKILKKLSEVKNDSAQFNEVQKQAMEKAEQIIRNSFTDWQTMSRYMKSLTQNNAVPFSDRQIIKSLLDDLYSDKSPFIKKWGAVTELYGSNLHSKAFWQGFWDAFDFFKNVADIAVIPVKISKGITTGIKNAWLDKSMQNIWRDIGDTFLKTWEGQNAFKYYMTGSRRGLPSFNKRLEKLGLGSTGWEDLVKIGEKYENPGQKLARWTWFYTQINKLTIVGFIVAALETTAEFLFHSFASDSVDDLNKCRMELKKMGKSNVELTSDNIPEFCKTKGLFSNLTWKLIIEFESEGGKLRETGEGSLLPELEEEVIYRALNFNRIIPGILDLKDDILAAQEYSSAENTAGYFNELKEYWNNYYNKTLEETKEFLKKDIKPELDTLGTKIKEKIVDPVIEKGQEVVEKGKEVFNDLVGKGEVEIAKQLQQNGKTLFDKWCSVNSLTPDPTDSWNEDLLYGVTSDGTKWQFDWNTKAGFKKCESGCN